MWSLVSTRDYAICLLDAYSKLAKCTHAGQALGTVAGDFQSKRAAHFPGNKLVVGLHTHCHELPAHCPLWRTVFRRLALIL